MPELADLLKRIEELRKILNDLGSKKALNNPAIVLLVKCSRDFFLMYEYGKGYLNSNE